jgi:hypothetical protein
MGAYVLLPLVVDNSVNSKSEQKVDSLPLLGLEPATIGRFMHRSNHTMKPHSTKQLF